jgi:Domain of Unknown Function (DUF1080).
MKTLRFISIAAAVLAMVSSCGGGKKTVLFNGENLDGLVAVTDSADTTGAVVFTVEDGLLCISGNPFGYIRTEKAYSDYDAHLEFRWVGEEGTNSGFFQRVQEGDGVWPVGVECQMCCGKVGDFVGLSGAFIEGSEQKGIFSFKPRTGESDSEKPAGEWNELDVEVRGTHIKYYVNGQLQNECETNLTSGYVAVQSEGGPLQVRNIYLIER